MAITKSNGTPPNELKVWYAGVLWVMVSVVKEMKTSTMEDTMYHGFICV